MRIKYLVITAVLATAILCFANPVSAVTIQELLAQIAALQAQLVELQAQQNNTTQTWCHTFNGDIRQGSSGSEVEALHIALQKEGFTISAQEVSAKKFYFSTISAVKSFQQKYMSEILTPFRLRIGTGFVGGSTRAKLNQLYGCTSSRTSCNSQNQCVVGGGGASCTSNTDCVSSTLPSITFTASDANNNVTTNLENKINTNITVQVGQTVKFDFSSTNATSCYVYANSVLMNNLTGTDVNGVEDSNITQGATSGRWQTLARTAGFTATYTVTCSNARGSASQNITLYSISSTQPSITVTSPLAGQQLVQGQTYNITWTSSGITANDGIYIKLINDGIAGGSVYYISPNPTVISNGLIQPTIFGNVNTYSWTVPSSVTPGSQYYITLESTNAGNMSGKSTGYFTIASPSCKILDIFSQQVSGYLYHEMFIKANNLPAENNYKIAGADSWSGTGFTVVQRYSDGSALLKGNQTFNTTAKNYILARKATITLTDLSGNQKCSVIGTVASAPVQNQPQLASIADIIARSAQQIQAMFK